MQEPDYQLEALLEYLEPPYKSEGERQLGRLLDRYGIPFFYEQPTIVSYQGKNHIWHPDFTLPTYNGLIVEYAGMVDVPEYAKGIRHKKRAYRLNDIKALFVYPWDIKGAAWPEEVIHKINKTYSNNQSPAGSLD